MYLQLFTTIQAFNFKPSILVFKSTNRKNHFMNAKVLSWITLGLVLALIALYLFVPQKIQPSGKVAVFDEKPSETSTANPAV